MAIRIPTLGQATGVSGRPPSRAQQAVAASQMGGQMNLANAIAYRAYLRGLTKQRQQADKQAEQIAQRSQQLGNRVREQGKAAQERAKVLSAPPAQAVAYGGNSYSSSIADRPNADVKLPRYPNYPMKYPDAPVYDKEPVGRLEQTARDYFWSMSERNANDTDKTYYNMWRSEMGAKQRWRDGIAKADKAYEKQVERYNKQLGRYNQGVANYQRGLNAFNAEMQAREQAASRPPIPLIQSGETADQRTTGRRRGTGRGTLLAGNTGGYNPATGGSGALGSRSLLG